MTDDREASGGELPPDEQARWGRVRQRLRAELGDAVYNSWFTRLELDGIQNGVMHLTVPTKFLKSWVQSHYAPRIKSRIANEFTHVERLAIDVRRRCAGKQKVREAGADVRRAGDVALCRKAGPGGLRCAYGDGWLAGRPVARRPAARQRTVSNSDFVGSPLDRRLSFSSFLVGPSNQLAYAAACRVAESRPGETPMFNPLYAHAAVGLGKTHLLQALAHATNDNRRRARLSDRRALHERLRVVAQCADVDRLQGAPARASTC